MKILTIGSDRKLFEDGSAVRARSLLYAQHMEELHIVVFTTRTKLKVESFNVGNLFVYPTNSSSRWLYVWDAIRLGKKIIIDNKFVRGNTVISAQDPFESGFVAYRLARIFRLPFQLQVHTDFLSPYFKDSFLNRIRATLASFLVPQADGLRVVSTRIAVSLKKRFPTLRREPDILPIFVDIDEIKNREVRNDLKQEFPQFNFIMFMASRLTREKEIDTAVHALASLVKEFPRAGLVISGSGPQENHLKNVVKNLGLENNIVFIGWQDDLISLYKTTHVFLVTSRYEGYGMSLIEAAAAGTPIVTTPVGIADHICTDGQNSFICPVGDSACFARSIKTLITDNSLRELFKQRIQDSISGMNISQDAYVSQYVALLSSLISKR